MSAGTVARSAAEQPVASPKSQRRRLAANVVCLFHEDRQPVAMPRWRGRYPRNVTSIQWWRTIRCGDVVRIVRGRRLNVGKRVRVLRVELGSGGAWWWVVESLDGLLWVGVEGSDANLYQSTEANLREAQMRKLSSRGRG